MKNIRRAAALRYDQKKDAAPVLVAAGEGLMGEQIEKIARENQVPVVKDENLANMLAGLEVGTEIPPHLYQLVAEVFAYVMQADSRWKKEGRRSSL